MAPHSSTLAWRIPWMEEPGGLQSTGLQRVRMTEATPWTAACQVSLSITNSWSLLKLMSIEVMISPNHLILCQSPSPLAFNLSQHQGFFS